MSFVDRISDIKKKQGLTNVKIGAMAGVKESTVRAWLNGKNPTADKIVKLCQSLNVPSDYLLGITDVWLEDTTTDEEKLLSYYRSLSEDDRITALGDLIRFANSRKNEYSSL